MDYPGGMEGNRQQGFTLLELSIVLVVIALIAGGIVVGAEMIKQAEVRSLIKQVTQIQAAVHTFEQKYGYLPGDYPKADQMFPQCPAAGGYTCSGNGDNKLTWFAGLCEGGVCSYEPTRFWQHLYYADLIQGNFSYYNGNNSPSMAQLYPKTIRNGYVIVRENCYDFGYGGTCAGDWYYDFGPLLNHGNGFLLPQEHQWIDTKMDDGNPSTGQVTASTSTDDNNGSADEWNQGMKNGYCYCIYGTGGCPSNGGGGFNGVYYINNNPGPVGCDLLVAGGAADF
jgi:prepilin-type N-terminal cleavage/methylation domain-containing protein